MKHSHIMSRFGIVLFLSIAAAQNIIAQGFGTPLTIQGLDHFTTSSASARGEGGTTIGLHNDASIMFLDPALLQTLQTIQVSVGAPQQYSTTQQTQQYAPLKYYSNFSLLMEGLTGYISNPTYDTTQTYNAGDSVQRPFDNIPPNWGRSKSTSPAVQAFAAVPFSYDGMKFTAGVGAVEYANLNWYFQNNNVLSPSVLSVKHPTITLPVNNADSIAIPVQWYQYLQSREGSINGYGGALSAAISDRLSLGVSGLILSGSSDDQEMRVDRGRLKFFSTFFRLDSIYYHVTSTTTSDYSGAEFTISGVYRSQHVTVGFSVKPPTTITRKFSGQIVTDTTGSAVTTAVNDQDKTTLPWRGTIGLSIALRENLTLGVEYEMRPYASMEYKKSDGTKTAPWLSSNLFHVGAEFAATPWLALRAGVREQAEVFEPEGAALEGEPVSYSIFSVGAGVTFSGVRINVAYEYSRSEYTDTWSDAISINSEINRNVIADVSYEIPW